MGQELKERVVVVTGGSKGIGHEIVKKAVEQGASVYYLSRSQAADHDGLQASWIQTDMSDEQSIETAFKQVLAEAGKVDVLVNNAGITRDGMMMRMKTEAFEEVLKVNLTGAFIACRNVVRSMAKARSGVIINISSVVGLMGNAGQANYAASKAGLIGFSKSLAREFSSRSVRVNVIAPGFIKTDMTDVLSDEVKESLSGQIPLARLGETSDVADAVIFLASDRASYITGQVLAVDGGMTM